MIEISKAVIIDDGKYLLLKRAARSRSFPGLWDFAGGKHEKGESSYDSVIRETKEETTLDIDPRDEFKKEEFYNPAFHSEKLLFHYFIPKIIKGEVRLSPDHSEFRWVSKEGLLKMKLHPAVTLFFK